jgi:hypothetical protein
VDIKVLLFVIAWSIFAIILAIHVFRRVKKYKTIFGDNFEKLSKLDNLDKLGELVNEVKKLNMQKELHENETTEGNQEGK